jgi:hypothetical protein
MQRLGAVLLAWALAGCSQTPVPDDVLPPSPAPVPMDVLASAAGAANPGFEGAAVVAEAAPVSATSSLRDEGVDDTWEAGSYELIAYCAGSGMFRMTFRIGAETAEGDISSCTPSVTTSVLDLRLDKPAEGYAVTIAAVGSAEAAISYRIVS